MYSLHPMDFVTAVALGVGAAAVTAGLGASTEVQANVALGVTVLAIWHTFVTGTWRLARPAVTDSATEENNASL